MVTAPLGFQLPTSCLAAPFSRLESENEVCETGVAAPKDGCSWRWVMSSGEVTAEPCDGVPVAQCPVTEAPPPIAVELRLRGGRSLHFDSTVDPVVLTALIRCQSRRKKGQFPGVKLDSLVGS